MSKINIHDLHTFLNCFVFKRNASNLKFTTPSLQHQRSPQIMCFMNRAPLLVHIISTTTRPPLATSQSGKKRLLTICCCYVKHKASSRVVSGKKYLSGLSSCECLGASGSGQHMGAASSHRRK